MLTAHPDLDGIFASNESGSAGASQALKNYAGKIKLVGFDSSPMLIDQLKAGVINSLGDSGSVSDGRNGGRPGREGD